MALPKLNVVKHETTLPFSKEKITFRPYTVEDERILLAAEAARDTDSSFYERNVLQVIKNCLGDDSDKINSLPAVDIEFLLLQLRAKSAGETVEFRFKDKETGDVKKATVNLEQFKVEIDPEHVYTIELSDDVGLKMRDLTFTQKISYASKFNEKNKTDIIFETIIDCVESVYDNDNIYVVGQDATREEVKQFIYSISGDASKKLYTFVGTLPQLSVEGTLEDGSKHTFTGGEVDFLAL